MRDRIRNILLEWIDEDDQQSRSILEDMYSRVDKDEFEEWREYDGDPDGDELSDFEIFLDDEKSITIEDGIVFFYELKDDVEDLIGNNMVGLHHFTSSKLQKSIEKDGLIVGKKNTNSYKNSHSGVYLTTRTSGNEIDSYKMKAVQKWKGEPIHIVVKMYLSELFPDPDDADIQSGATQFISGNISPDRIIEIEKTY